MHIPPSTKPARISYTSWTCMAQTQDPNATNVSPPPTWNSNTLNPLSCPLQLCRQLLGALLTAALKVRFKLSELLLLSLQETCGVLGLGQGLKISGCWGYNIDYAYWALAMRRGFKALYSPSARNQPNAVLHTSPQCAAQLQNTCSGKLSQLCPSWNGRPPTTTDNWQPQKGASTS